MERIKKRLQRPGKSLPEEHKDDATSEHAEADVHDVRTYKRHKPSSKEHKDKAVGRTFFTKCRPAGLSLLAPKLNDYQRRAVEEIGFFGMLQLRGFGRMSWQRISWFVENFNGSSRVLSFEGNRNLVITSDDIHDLFMLPRNEGVPVLRNDERTKDFLTNFKNRNRIEDNLPVSSVQKMLLEMRDGRMILRVDLNVMRSLMSVERISSFDWCGFKWQGRVSPTTLPLIQHWDKKSIRARLRAELNAGGFGRGEWVEGVYPITKGAPNLEEDVGMVDDRVVVEGDMLVQGPSLEPRAGPSREPLEEALLLMKRDLNMVTHVHLERLGKMRDLHVNMGTEESPSLSPDSMFFSSSKLHEYIDEVVDNFWKMKAEKGEKVSEDVEVELKPERAQKDPEEEEDFECPKFDLLTPTPLEDVNKILDDVVSDLENVGGEDDKGIELIQTPPSRRPCTENLQQNIDEQAGGEGVLEGKEHEEKIREVWDFWVSRIEFQLSDLYNVDRIDRDDVMFKLAEIACEQMGVFLNQINHPKCADFESYGVEFPAFNWNRTGRNIDCAIYIMHQMENFLGAPYESLELSKLDGRRRLRAQYAARILLSPLNGLRKKIQHDSLEIIKNNKKYKQLKGLTSLSHRSKDSTIHLKVVAMAFLRKAGSILGRTVSSRVNQETLMSNPSILQAIRWMSSSRIFVGGLSYNTNDAGLREAFNKYGEIVDVRLITDRETGRSRGFGFITYTSVEEASTAIQALDQKVYYGGENSSYGGHGQNFGVAGGVGGSYGGGSYGGGAPAGGESQTGGVSYGNYASSNSYGGGNSSYGDDGQNFGVAGGSGTGNGGFAGEGSYGDGGGGDGGGGGGC
ncbi:glycine-rich RNA-binding protein 3 [Perilla frutescens var. frutescens]|nr:glycine-rich RNA-binding protein 3 [Perilla frutescens var. frutescens]